MIAEISSLSDQQLEGIDTADLVICDEIPNFCSFGNVSTSLKVFTAIPNPLLQIFNSLKFFIQQDLML